jgi:hypothetical protein
VGNWKQVQARIRKARAGADAPAKLEQLFLKTRDGMVAFELAKVHESGERMAEALDWYRKAHERFRRDEWRRKAAEAIARLGGAPQEVSTAPAEGEAPAHAEKLEAEAALQAARGGGLPERLYHYEEPTQAAEGPAEQVTAEASEFAAAMRELGTAAVEAEAAVAAAGEKEPGARRRRRGRRGGRRHRKGRAVGKGAPVAARAPAPPLTHAAEAAPPPPRISPPAAHAETPGEAGWVGAHAEQFRTRAGDPGLASRVARLEMQVRRLLACPPHRVGEAEKAPAGPGVLLLSDADLATHYFISACDTLRIEISRLTRSERGGRGRGRGWEGESTLRSRLAEHLEISESQVGKYLESHCVVRWLQLDEGASRVAHFAIGVLEPILNE